MTWEMMPLGRMGHWTGGGTPSKSRPDFWDGDIPWLSPKDMGHSTLTGTKDHISLTAVQESSTKLIPAGSVAVVTRSGILEHTLPSALVPFEVTLNQDMKAVTPLDSIEAKWILWGLRAHERQILANCRKAGTTVASIEWKRFAQFELPVPPLPEQQRIVELIEEHLSHLDAADAALTDASNRAEALLDAKLGRWVIEHHDAEHVPLSVIADTQLGKMLDAKRSAGDPTPYLANINVRWGEFDLTSLKSVPLTESERRKFEVRPGDLLLCEGGEPGRGAIWRGDAQAVAFQKALHRVRLKPSAHVSAEFLAAFLREGIKHHRWDHLFTGTTIKHLPQDKLRQLAIPVTHPQEQRGLLERVVRLQEAQSQVTRQLELASVRSGILRRSVLAAAFSGRLTGRSADADVIEETAARL